MHPHQPTPGSIGGVVLAAGRGARLGTPTPKPLCAVDGIPLVQRTTLVLRAAGLEPVVVVLGYAAAAVRTAVAGLGVVAVENPAWAEGQSTSVRAGIQALPTHAGAVIVAPCDQPHLETGLVVRLVERHRAGAEIVAPRWRDRPGAPVLFARRWFPALTTLCGDTGGRAVMRAHPDAVAWIEVDDPRVLEDVDTVEDLARARGVAGDPWPDSTPQSSS